MIEKKIELLDESCSVFGIPNYFDYIFKKRKILIKNPPIQMLISRFDEIITFENKTG